jgi:hypothetical protein
MRTRKLISRALEQIDEEMAKEKQKLNESKKLEERSLRAAMAMRNHDLGRVTTIHSLAARTSDGQELADLEQGPRVVSGTLGASPNNAEALAARGAAITSGPRRRRGLPWWPFRQ